MNAQCSNWSKADSDSSTNDKSNNNISSAGNADSDLEQSKQFFSLNLGDSTTKSVLVGDSASLINEERAKGSNKDYDYAKISHVQSTKFVVSFYSTYFLKVSHPTNYKNNSFCSFLVSLINSPYNPQKL